MTISIDFDPQVLDGVLVQMLEDYRDCTIKDMKRAAEAMDSWVGREDLKDHAYTLQCIDHLLRCYTGKKHNWPDIKLEEA